MPIFHAYDGTELAYRLLGKGAPLICLPGGPMRAGAYLGDLGGLSAHRQLVVLDLRGTGSPRCRTTRRRTAATGWSTTSKHCAYTSASKASTCSHTPDRPTWPHSMPHGTRSGCVRSRSSHPAPDPSVSRSPARTGARPVSCAGTNRGTQPGGPPWRTSGRGEPRVRSGPPSSRSPTDDGTLSPGPMPPPPPDRPTPKRRRPITRTVSSTRPPPPPHSRT